MVVLVGDGVDVRVEEV
jgi:hypothetical protein